MSNINVDHAQKPSVLLVFALPLLIVAHLGWRICVGLTGSLAHVPGPLISKFTHLRLKINVLRGERVRYVHKLHQEYGPIVRISPHEVSISDIAAVKIVYKVGGSYLKTEWYDSFTGNQHERNMFTMVDSKAHGHHRRLLAHNFSDKSVAGMEPYIAKNVKLAIQRMAEEVDELGYVDVFKWFTFMATDVIGEASFGESFRMLEIGKKDQYIHDLERVTKLGTVRAEFPKIFQLVRRFPHGPAKDIYRAIERLQSYADQSIQRYWRQLRENPDNVKPTLLTREYAGVEEGWITQGQIQRDAQGNIVAGTDTTAITATYMVWLLSRHPEIEQALIEGVSRLPVDFTDDHFRALPLLNNVINETLRLRGPIMQALPRYVPAGGVDFGGYYLPQGKVVGVQAYTMHMNPEVWTEPEQFDPARWNNPSKDMRDSFLPFGGGSRICVGMHFAQLELRHSLANFYRTFTGGVKKSAAEGFSDDEMLPMSYFLSPPKGTRCLVERRK